MKFKRKVVNGWKRISENRVRINYNVIKKTRKRLISTLNLWRKVVIRKKILKNAKKKGEVLSKKRRIRMLFRILEGNKKLEVRIWQIYRLIRLWKTAVFRSSELNNKKIAVFRRKKLIFRYFFVWFNRISKQKSVKIVGNYRLSRLFLAWNRVKAKNLAWKKRQNENLEFASEHYERHLTNFAFQSFIQHWSNQLTLKRHKDTLTVSQRKKSLQLKFWVMERWKWLPVVSFT